MSLPDSLYRKHRVQCSIRLEHLTAITEHLTAVRDGPQISVLILSEFKQFN